MAEEGVDAFLRYVWRPKNLMLAWDGLRRRNLLPPEDDDDELDDDELKALFRRYRKEWFPEDHPWAARRSPR